VSCVEVRRSVCVMCDEVGCVGVGCVGEGCVEVEHVV
jgi:hypothetical protein